MSFLKKIFGASKCPHPQSRFAVSFDPDRVGGGENAEFTTAAKPRAPRTMCEYCYGEELKAAWPPSPSTPIVMAEFPDDATRLAFVPRSRFGTFDSGRWKDLGDAKWTLKPGEACQECKLPATAIWLSPDESVRSYSSNVERPLKEHLVVAVCGNCAADRIVNGIRDHDMTSVVGNAPTDEGGILVPFV
jgi:hypothetical protein